MPVKNPPAHGEYTYIRTDENGRPVCIFHTQDDEYQRLKDAGERIFRFPYGTELRRKTGTEPDPNDPEKTIDIYIPQKIDIATGELVDDNG
jgi:hypothetical protein